MVGAQFVVVGQTLAASLDDIRNQVIETERAFAKTMADRDFDAFKSFIAPDAVFWGGEAALRGRDVIAADWKPLFDGADAPFSWKPETVMVLDSGDLAFSTGPVSDPDGKVYAYFNSVWRKGENGQWQIIFDKGQNLQVFETK